MHCTALLGGNFKVNAPELNIGVIAIKTFFWNCPRVYVVFFRQTFYFSIKGRGSDVPLLNSIKTRRYLTKH